MTRFRTEPAVRTLAAQFVPIKVNTSVAKDWTRLTRTYKHEGNGIPILMVIRGDGEQMYGKSGSPSQLTNFLASHLKRAGRVLSPAEVAEFKSAVEEGRKNLDEKDYASVVDVVDEYAGSGSFAEVAVEMDKLAGELTKQVETMLAEADKKLKESATAFDGALSFAAIEQDFKKLDALSKPLAAKKIEYRRDAELRDLVDQARIVARARSFADDGKPDRALSMMQALVEKSPETPGGKLAASEIPDLKQAVAESASSSLIPSKSKPGKSSGAAIKKAASKLRFGKALMDRNPSKAAEYLQEAIKLAPDSDVAAEAKKLLKKID